jgi:hypothetical protein
MLSPDVTSALIGDPVLWNIRDRRSGALLELGARRACRRRIPNDTLPEEQQDLEGEHSLLIQCAWELALPKMPPSAGLVVPLSRAVEELDRLIGLTITAAVIDESSLRLELTFDDNSVLRVDPTARPSRLVGGYTVRIDRSYWHVSDSGEVTEQHA